MGSAGSICRYAIDVRDVAKSFGGTRALDGVDLAVEAGRVHALLGPNGAGKTTLVRILSTLVVQDRGTASVCGIDTRTEPAGVRKVLGLTGQFTAIDHLLSGRENLEMVAELCQLPRARARRRASELLAEFDLEGAADRLARTYSGGMLRRLDFAASLVSEPPVLVLDEPTTGLDPRSRATVWAAVDKLVAQGTTVLLTTQYLEEADRLAGRVSLIDRGRVVAGGTADELKRALGGDVLEVTVTSPEAVAEAAVALAGIGEPRTVEPDRRRVVIAADGMATLRAALDHLDGAGIPVEDIAVRRPSLDDVFLALTGSDIAGEEDARTPPSPAPPDRASRRRRRAVRQPAGARSLGGAIRDGLIVARRNVKRIGRTPRLLAVTSLQPILYVLMFRYVFGGSLQVPHTTYIDYLLPGTFVTATLLGATTAVAMATDLSGGMVDRFRSLPMARSAVFAGRCVADLLRSLLVVGLVLAAGTVIGFRFHTHPLAALGALGMTLAAAFSFVWLYALIGVLMKDPETAQLTGFLTVVPLIFASSAFVQVERMPGWLQVFARHQPVTVAVDAVRALCEGGPVAAAAWQSGLWIVAMVGIFGTVSVALYQRR